MCSTLIKAKNKTGKKYLQKHLDIALAAAAWHDIKLVKLFLDNGANPTYDGNKSLVNAAKNSRYDIIGLLLKNVKK